MKINPFLDRFDLFTDAPNGVQKLRELILQLAVRGQLVPQDPEDEPVEALLGKIKSEREALIREGKLAKPKALLPLMEQDIPCAIIPSVWKWVRFGDVILDIEAGTSPQCEKRSKIEEEWGVIKISAVSWDKFNPEENKALPSAIQPRLEHEIKTGDFLMSRANTSLLVGKSVVVDQTPKRLLLNDKTLRVIFPDGVNKQFFNLYNNSLLARDYYARQGTGTSDSMKNITRDQIRNLPVPLPPLAEQKRIVAKVDELMALCDRLEAQQNQRRSACIRINDGAITQLLTASVPEEFDRHWQRICDNFDLFYSLPDNITKLRQAILQLAVMGKLVPPSSGATWNTVPLTNLCTALQTGPFGSLLHASDYITGGIPVINPQNIQGDEICITPDKTISSTTRDRLKNYVLQKNDVVLARRGELGRCAVISEKEDGWLCGTGSLFIRLLPDVFPRFIKLWLNSPRTREKLQSYSVGSTMNNLNQRIIGSLMVALPPLAEQKRIVEKVDRLMTLCDQLEAQLNQAQGKSERLMEVAVRQILAA